MQEMSGASLETSRLDWVRLRRSFMVLHTEVEKVSVCGDPTQ